MSRIDLINTNYILYSDRSRYLFKVVRPRFHRQAHIGAFDLFSIVAWKANRAKSRIAKRLLKKERTLERAARRLSRDLWKARGPKCRLLLLIRKWDIPLPMASAILTVLWPREFTIYDQRVCEQLGRLHRGDYSRLRNQRSPGVWDGYRAFRDAVCRVPPRGMTLREKDRRSVAEQLERDIRRKFRQGRRRAR